MWEDHSHCPLDREIHLGSVNNKLALTKSIANDLTTKAFAICLYRD